MKLISVETKLSPWLKSIQSAHRCEENFDWEGAEECYLNAIRVCDHLTLQSNTYDTLAALYSFIGRQSEALEAAHKATKIGEKSNICVVALMALVAEGYLNLKSGNNAVAEQIVEEALKKLECDRSIDEEAPLFRARIMLLRARCAIEKGNWSSGQADLKSVWSQIEPWQCYTMAGGFQDCIAKWWEANAELCQRYLDTKGAVSARREVVIRTRKIARLGSIEGPYKHNTLAMAWWKLAKALTEASDPLDKRAYNESCSLRRSIGMPAFKGD
jgi:tetratricopeptide (TPR) repeat protein